MSPPIPCTCFGGATNVSVLPLSPTQPTSATRIWLGADYDPGAYIQILRRRNKRSQKAGGLGAVNQRNGSRYHQASGDESGDTQLDSTISRPNPTAQTNRNNSATVDRHASIRSVMTLPAYRQSAALTEQVLGREGERDGIDVIVDLPSEEQAEALRDEEMEALYQIRATRRQQNAAAEALRREREEAEQRHDRLALAAIRARTRNANSSNREALEELRRDAERVKDTRQRSVSTVSYADLGVARHDGTRLRASSNDSERMGLLSDAASITRSTHSGAHSPSLHRRDRSVSSLGSFDSDFQAVGESDAFHDGRRRRSSADNRAGSSPELIGSDLAAETAPPPEYEEVSLGNDLQMSELSRSTTPVEPPPDYSGPYRSGSQATGRSLLVGRNVSPDMSQNESGRLPGRLDVSGAPQLPEIVIQQPSAHPDNEGSRGFTHTNETRS
ncbi:hypothetical protein B0I35DRAFT_408373 [Stachybotrys elegans]|uniref:Uncharacterized protein n=1 Tax=Stachybotrys elegans TaxID=80388 RepID=A0A8K0SVE4_9HYPO|nr:hypothetical protein B0I35DRAFT_408373 [Stachybotrys elegans]